MTIGEMSRLRPLELKVLSYMRGAGYITARNAQMDLDITSASLTRRICDLIDLGYDIDRVRRRHPVTNKIYTRYVLNEAS